jgi:hypothetical protein
MCAPRLIGKTLARRMMQAGLEALIAQVQQLMDRSAHRGARMEDVDATERRLSVVIPDDIVFCDYCGRSWYYALGPGSNAQASSVYIVDGARPERLVAASLSLFLQAILEDAEALYPEVNGAG